MSIDVDRNVEDVIAYAPTKYGAVAALAMLTYDYAITFDDEFEFVWKRRWSLGKILFIFHRYFGLLSLLSVVMGAVFMHGPVCNGLIWWTITSEVIAIVTAEIILILRIYAVYNCSRRLLLVMIVFLVAAIASSSWLAISTLSTSDQASHDNPIAQMKVSRTIGCRPNGTTPPHAFFFWIPFLIFETFLVALMLCKCWRVYRIEGGSRLLHLIIRDSMFIALLANCILWGIPSLDPGTASGWAIAMPCAVCCRLLLNMRENMYKETTSIWTVMSP
ncbi:hypothetical protein JB92DRAFT_2944614 [Gautieria morchelliformis]|nr:hypothetical protein JB92DRAFT_2944614 [Gautieria morchelliformis]